MAMFNKKMGSLGNKTMVNTKGGKNPYGPSGHGGSNKKGMKKSKKRSMIC